MRKIIFPIHVKLIGFTLAILACSLGFYIFYAIDLFKTDKIAYVFESVSSQNEQVAQTAAAKIENAFAVTSLLNQAKNSTRVAREIFKNNPMLLGYLEFNQKELERSVFAPEITKINIEGFRNFLRDQMKSPQGLKKAVFEGRSYFICWEDNQLTVWKDDYLSSGFPESGLYSYHLLIEGQNVLDDQEGPLFQEIRAKDKMQQAFVFENGERLIVAMEPVWQGSGVVFTAANYQKAIEASLNLRDKSLFFGLFVAGIVIFLVLLFSRFFTRPIEKLFQASQKFSQRDFSHRVKLSTGDELSVLGDSFNHMASEITHYMDEMKEKSRLENELKTAQLVQESFFPQDLIESERLKLKAFYRPAAECGGDWWGYLKEEGVEALIMIDVTGHGTAAALVTAVIHNSLTALKYIGKKDPDFLKSPAKIMGFLNESLCSVEVNLYASAFVMTFAADSGGKTAYCNASHNPPYQIPLKEGLKKSDFIPLMEKVGPRLGENLASSFSEVEIETRRGEKLILFTDGLIECENPQDKAYGTRRFVKKLIELFPEEPALMTHEIVRDVFEFAGGVEPKDDITLICAELK